MPPSPVPFAARVTRTMESAPPRRPQPHHASYRPRPGGRHSIETVARQACRWRHPD